jgi:hypothetical protein
MPTMLFVFRLQPLVSSHDKNGTAVGVQFSYENEDRKSTIKLQLVDERVKNNTEKTWEERAEVDAKYSTAKLKNIFP